MYIKKENVNIDEMSLYDYVIRTYEKHADLTEGRLKTLNYYLGNCYAKYINFGEFRSTFLNNGEGFLSVMRVLTDPNKLEELNIYGLMCYEAKIAEQNSIIDGKSLIK